MALRATLTDCSTRKVTPPTTWTDKDTGEQMGGKYTQLRIEDSTGEAHVVRVSPEESQLPKRGDSIDLVVDIVAVGYNGARPSLQLTLVDWAPAAGA